MIIIGQKDGKLWPLSHFTPDGIATIFRAMIDHVLKDEPHDKP
jgi:hypothetical protein